MESWVNQAELANGVQRPARSTYLVPDPKLFDDKVDVVVDQIAQSLHDAKALLERHGFKVTV